MTLRANFDRFSCFIIVNAIVMIDKMKPSGDELAYNSLFIFKVVMTNISDYCYIFNPMVGLTKN